MIGNIVKINLNNLLLVLKTCLTKFVMMLLFFGIMFLCLYYFSDVIFEFQNTAYFNFQGVNESPLSFLNTLYTGILNIYDAVYLNFIGFGLPLLICFIVFIVFGVPFLNADYYPLNFIVFNKLTSNYNVGYFKALIKKFLKGYAYSFLINLITIPLDFLCGYGIIKLMGINGGLESNFIPLSLICIIVAYLAIKSTLTFLIAPATSLQHSFKKGISKGFKHTFKNFHIIFGINVITFAIFTLLTFFAIGFTYGVLLILIIPYLTYSLVIAANVVFLESIGNRYYTDPNTIFTPKKQKVKYNTKKLVDII